MKRGSWARRGIEQAVRRLVSTRSAFTMGDVINLAAAGGSPDELNSVYEWYYGRTRSAIRTSFGVALGAAAALIGQVRDPIDRGGSFEQGLPILALAVVAVLAVLGAAFQLRELAQLPREVTVALRLRETFAELKEVGLGTPQPKEAQSLRPLRWLIGIGLLVGVCAAPAVLWWTTQNAALVLCSVAIAAALALLPNALSEFAPSADAPKTYGIDSYRILAESIGDIRLDDYIHDRDWAN